MKKRERHLISHFVTASSLKGKPWGKTIGGRGTEYDNDNSTFNSAWRKRG